MAKTELSLIVNTVKKICTQRNAALKQNNKSRWGEIVDLLSEGGAGSVSGCLRATQAKMLADWPR